MSSQPASQACRERRGSGGETYYQGRPVAGVLMAGTAWLTLAGLLLADDEQVEQAVEVFQTGIKADPYHCPLYQAFGLMLSELGRRDAARWVTGRHRDRQAGRPNSASSSSSSVVDTHGRRLMVFGWCGSVLVCCCCMLLVQGGVRAGHAAQPWGPARAVPVARLGHARYDHHDQDTAVK